MVLGYFTYTLVRNLWESLGRFVSGKMSRAQKGAYPHSLQTLCLKASEGFPFVPLKGEDAVPCEPPISLCFNETARKAF